MKLAHQVLVINAFLEEFGIEIDVPDRYIEAPKLDYAIVTVNGERALVVHDGGSLIVHPGDRVKIDHLVGNYERLMFADLQGYGGLNDNGREIVVGKVINVVVRKDARICGNFRIIPREEPQPERLRLGEVVGTPSSANFIVEINGVRRLVPEGDEILLVLGDKLRLLDYLAPNLPSGFNVNLMGFVGNPEDNRGEDRGYIVDTGKDLLRNWSLDGKGMRYAVAVKKGRREIARMTIRLVQPRLEYVVVQCGEERPVVLQAGENWRLRIGARFTILGARSNAPDDTGLSFQMLNDKGRELVLEDDSFVAPSDSWLEGDKLTLAVMRGKVRMGSIGITLTSSDNAVLISR